MFRYDFNLPSSAFLHRLYAEPCRSLSTTRYRYTLVPGIFPGYSVLQRVSLTDPLDFGQRLIEDRFFTT